MNLAQSFILHRIVEFWFLGPVHFFNSILCFEAFLAPASFCFVAYHKQAQEQNEKKNLGLLLSQHSRNQRGPVAPHGCSCSPPNCVFNGKLQFLSMFLPPTTHHAPQGIFCDAPILTLQTSQCTPVASMFCYAYPQRT